MNTLSVRSLNVLRKWPVVISLLIIAATGITKWQATWMPENATVPSVPIPAVNAKRYFLHASSMLTMSIKKVPPAGYTGPLDNYYVNYSQRQKDAIIKENLPVFDEVEKGLAYPYADDTVRSLDLGVPYYSDYRRLANALSAASEDRMTHNDWAGALHYDLDIMQMGSLISHNSVSGPQLAASCENDARYDMAKLITHLTIAESVSTANQLKMIDEASCPPSQALADEKHYFQASLLWAFSGPWRKTLWDIETTQYGRKQPSPLEKIALYSESPRTAYDNYTNYMNLEIAEAKLPWSDQIKRKAIPFPNDLIGQTFTPIGTIMVCRQYVNMSANRLLELQIALHAYRISHGSYPRDLKSLTPAILTMIPLDPFTDNQPFHYSPNADKYLLYSVGPDAVDNGGTPIIRTEQSDAMEKYLVFEPDQKGDFVAGVNYY
jgi:hypothetical protein